MSRLKRSLRMALAAALWTAAATPSVAASGIPSCYAANGMAAPAAPVDRALFVVIDQTTALDSKLISDLGRQLQALIVPGTSFQIFSFSAFSQGRYLQLLAEGTLEPPLKDQSVRDATAVKSLRTLDACLNSQFAYGTRMAANAVAEALRGASTGLAKSDVVGSLSTVSRAVRETSGRVKTVLVVSDMLENSSITSFYARDRMRQIDPKAELDKVAQAGIPANFGGASVYVLGAGLVPEATSASRGAAGYRSTQSLAALRAFWAGYFASANAKLEEFGTPALLTPIR